MIAEQGFRGGSGRLGPVALWGEVLRGKEQPGPAPRQARAECGPGVSEALWLEQRKGRVDRRWRGVWGMLGPDPSVGSCRPL